MAAPKVRDDELRARECMAKNPDITPEALAKAAKIPSMRRADYLRRKLLRGRPAAQVPPVSATKAEAMSGGGDPESPDYAAIYHEIFDTPQPEEANPDGDIQGQQGSRVGDSDRRSQDQEGPRSDGRPD